MIITRATRSDLPEILQLQKEAFLQEAQLYNNLNIQPLTQTTEEIETEYQTKVFLKALAGSAIVGSVRANLDGAACWVNKLMVHPLFQKRGIGKALLLEIEKYFTESEKFLLGTGAKSTNNIRLYESAGYRILKYDKFHDGVDAVFMEKVIKRI
ncbi:MAG: GNAT family N-acetyltransferase [Bacteroidales bacterium]|nr:GNAT family N-acetyltransferase [Bacteroidales bacterium]